MDIAVEPVDVRLQHDGHTGHPGHTARSADESTDGLVVVRVSGDLDIHTSPQLRATLTGLLGPATTGTPSPASAGQRVRGVILDLREVPFMDSSALGVLVYGYKLTRPHRQGYAVVATSSLITKMFEITGLARSMPLHPDVAAAVTAIGPATSA